MEKRILKVLTLIACGALLFSCAATQPVMFAPSQFPPDEYVTKVDNFEVIFDGSESMGWSHNQQKKLDIAKAFVNSMNQTLPELGFTAGFRSFGHCSAVSDQKTMLGYGMEKYSTAGLAAAVDSITCAGGNSPLDVALNAANEDIKPLSGKTALIVVTDGKDMAREPIEAAEKLAADYGDNLCIYGVLVGDDMGGQKLLESVVGAAGCGSVTMADDLSTADAMAEFVKTVFLTHAPDSDGDGVLDAFDQCPDTPAGVVVDSVGCPLDTDMDGVYDYLDKCPGTPKGAAVNMDGCWLPGPIYFNMDSSKIRPDAVPILNDVIEVMGKNPTLGMKLNGHTCTIGKSTYNDRLGVKRAKSAKKYMMEHGVSEDRITVESFGFSKPAASNDTEAGRALNRRVEFEPMK